MIVAREVMLMMMGALGEHLAGLNGIYAIHTTQTQLLWLWFKVHSVL